MKLGRSDGLQNQLVGSVFLHSELHSLSNFSKLKAFARWKARQNSLQKSWEQSRIAIHYWQRIILDYNSLLRFPYQWFSLISPFLLRYWPQFSQKKYLQSISSFSQNDFFMTPRTFNFQTLETRSLPLLVQYLYWFGIRLDETLWGFAATTIYYPTSPRPNPVWLYLYLY